MKIYELTAEEIAWLCADLALAQARDKRVRFAFDGGLKVKVGEGMWTPPLGEPEKSD